MTLVTIHHQLLTAWELSVRAACSLTTTVPTLPRCRAIILTSTFVMIRFHSYNHIY